MSPEQTRSTASLENVRALYLDLLKRTLLNLIYPEADASIAMGVDPVEWIKKTAAGVLGSQLLRPRDANAREDGTDWPKLAHTMVGMKRLSNLQTCLEDVIQNDIPGDVIETGVWRGGASIMMRGVLKAYDVQDRIVWVADSFQGLPEPKNETDKHDISGKLHAFKELAISLEQVQSNFSRYGLLDDQVRFLKGWFSETLSKAPIERLALIRLDGDMYESTMDGLTALYPKLSVGGYLIVDDYSSIPACQKAVQDYRLQHKIEEPIIPIDWTGVYWQRKS